jgi:hypothetical protein
MRLTTSLLADAARVEGGKLYIHGGGWDRINVSGLPSTHPTMALVLIFEIPYDEALRDQSMSIHLLDEDDSPLGPEIKGMLNVGHAPRTKPGAPTFVPQAITIQLVTFERPGRYRFRVLTGDVELASVPFEVSLNPAQAQATSG